MRLHLPFIKRDVAAPTDPGKRKRRSFLGAGPITVTGNGTVDVGTRRASLNSIGQSTTSYSSALTFGLERRTENAALALTQGVGYSSGASSIGQLQANYRTPAYSLDYGPVAGGGSTQLQVGGFTRGVVLTKPRPNGEIQLITAATLQQDGSGFRALGLRRTFVARTNALTLTALA
ncbi:MAG: hypothetical protein ABR591_01745, partial [Candidatus Velthaea sp.]